MRSITLSTLFLVFAWMSVTNSHAADNPVAIAIHGGAGTILPERMTDEVEHQYREALGEAVRAGYAVLQNGGSSREAIVVAIRIMEDSPLFNAGHGAVLTNEGTVELDASIMEGRTLNAGAITGITHVRNPIVLADEILRHSVHVMLMGEGAEAFARERGLELVDNEYFRTERRRRQLERVQAEDGRAELSEDGKELGTVGAVAIDRAGDIAAGTSTGGMTNKRFGRVGDSPIIGAGTYADNRACGISATGHGEFFIRAAVAHDICARVAYKGISLQQAADEVIMGKLVEMGADGGIIGIDADGNIVFSFNSAGMYRAAIDTSGNLEVAIFKSP